MSDPKSEQVAPSGRPSNDRDGACICDYNPETTDGPQEDCPFHGRPYAYWIERGDALYARLTAASVELLDGLEDENLEPTGVMERALAALGIVPRFRGGDDRG